MVLLRPQPIRSELLRLLACPACRAGLTQSDATLTCTQCGTEYAVRGSVPRLVRGELPPGVADTADAFGWQWHAFTRQHPEFRGEFFEWLAPLGPADLQGRVVLDAGCGKGRHLLVSAECGAAQIVGLDLSSAVDVASQVTANLPNVDVVQGDLLAPPFSGGFDVVYSIGVIHHVPNPAQAVRALATCLRPGGTLHVWVYGYEGNAPVRLLLDPVRRLVARRAPRGVIRAATLPMAVVLTAIARLVRARPSLRVPYAAYLRELGAFSVPHIWTIIYDQLMAPTTHYVRREELESWLRSAGLTDVQVINSRGMSWAGTARRPTS